MSTDLDTLVAALDPAPRVLDAAQTGRRDRTLERILAAGPQVSPVSAATAPLALRRRRTTVRPGRVALVAAASVAVAGAGVVMPFLDPGPAAFASWTAAPGEVAAADLAVVDPVCRLFRDGSLDGRPVRYRLAASERRGDLVGLLHRSEDPDLSSVCVVRQAPGSRWVTGVQAATGGSSGPAYPAAPGGITEGAIAELEEISVTDGAVGAGVVGVTVHAGGLSVEATVSEGRYYAWWPGPALGPSGPEGAGGPESLLTYDVHLADGTTRSDVEPTPPG